jgi:subtilisin family serine protease
VAGTVAAAFDGGGVIGVGPNLGIASYNVFEFYDFPDDGAGPLLVAFDEALWQAMLDATERGYDVINMSLGGYIVRSASKEDVAAWTAWNRIADYVTRQGVTIVASAGNGNLDLNGPVDHIPSDVTGVISTGASGIRPDPIFPQDDSYDIRAFYSNYGASVILSAPGGDCGLADSCDELTRPANWFEYLVFSTYVEANPLCAATASCPVGYAWAGGTSMSSPHVSGAAGLVADQNPGLNPHQVISILKRTTDNLGDRQQFGHGMLNVYTAVD